MNFRYGLLLPAMLVALLLVGSVSAKKVCPDIPPPPYIPKSPAEDIVTVTTYIDQPNPSPSAAGGAAGFIGYMLHLTIVFAAPTPPADQAINILVTMWQGNPPTETVLTCDSSIGPAKTTYTIDYPIATDDGTAQIAVYAWLGPQPQTDRAPNGGFYIADRMVRQFDDPEGAVGGIVMPTSKLEIVAPFAALAGLFVAVSAVVAIKKRRD